MKDFKDRKIQEALEEKNISLEHIEDRDLYTYTHIYEALSAPDDALHLPKDFADSIVMKIEKRKREKALFFLCLGILSGIGMFSGALIALLYCFPDLVEVMKSVFANIEIILFVAALLIAIQLFDWFLIKRKSPQLYNK